MKKLLLLLPLTAVLLYALFCCPGCKKPAPPPLRPEIEAERLLAACLERERCEFAAKDSSCRYFRLKDGRLAGFSPAEIKFFATKEGFQYNCARHYRYREISCSAANLSVSGPVNGKNGFAAGEITFDLTRSTFESGGEAGTAVSAVILRRYPFPDGGALAAAQNSLQSELRSALPAEEFDLLAISGRSRRHTVRRKRVSAAVVFDPAKGRWELKTGAPEAAITDGPEWEDDERFAPEELKQVLESRKFAAFDGGWLRAGDVDTAKKQNAGQVFFKDIWVALSDVKNGAKLLTEYIDAAKEIYFSNVTSPDDGGEIGKALSTLLDRMFLVREDTAVFAAARKVAGLLADYELRRRYALDFADSGNRLMDLVTEWKKERKWRSLDFAAKRDGVKTSLVNLQLENARRLTLLTVFRNNFQNMPGNVSGQEADDFAREYRLPAGKFRQTLFGYVSLLQLASGSVPRRMGQLVSPEFMQKFTSPCTKCGGGGDFQCEHCHGTRICPTCHGTGRRTVANMSKLTIHIEYNVTYSEAPCPTVCQYCASGSLHRNSGCRSCGGQGYFIKRAMIQRGVREYELRLTDALDTELARLENHSRVLKDFAAKL